MKHRNLIALTLAAALWSGMASSAMENIENAYETDAAHVRLPSNASGDLAIDPCPTCESVRLRVNAQTRYLLGRSAVSLAAFRQAATAAGAEQRLMVVFYDLRSNTVTRIVLGAAN